jgi:hypothetical protein
MEEPTKQISRRDAMKLLGAAAGATVLANLPSKWQTPQLAAGVLPAHAQTSVGSRVIKSCGYAGGGAPIPAGGSAPGANPPLIPVNATAQISPGDSGVSVHYKIVPTNATSPDPAEGDRLTGPAGIVGVAFDLSPTGGTVSVTVTWTFTSPSDGTGSCHATLIFTD